MPELRVLTAEPRGEDIVKVLETALEHAKEGRLSSISVAGVERDGSPWWKWSDVPNASALVGAIERMKADFIRVTDA